MKTFISKQTVEACIEFVKYWFWFFFLRRCKEIFTNSNLKPSDYHSSGLPTELSSRIDGGVPIIIIEICSAHIIHPAGCSRRGNRKKKHEYKQFTVIAKTKLCTKIHVQCNYKYTWILYQCYQYILEALVFWWQLTVYRITPACIVILCLKYDHNCVGNNV